MDVRVTVWWGENMSLSFYLSGNDVNEILDELKKDLNVLQLGKGDTIEITITRLTVFRNG